MRQVPTADRQRSRGPAARRPGGPAARRPGYRDAAGRHFDAFPAVDTRFYEVAAKSILNG